MVERHEPVWESEHKFGLGLRVPRRAHGAATPSRPSRATDFVVMIVGYPGHFDLGPRRGGRRRKTRRLQPDCCRGGPLVDDRGRGRRSPLSAVLSGVDRRSMRAADLVIADTEATPSTSGRWPGSRATVDVASSAPRSRSSRPAGSRETFGACSYGKLIPLHGLETILAAARLVPEVPFGSREPASSRACSSTTCRPTSTGSVGSRTSRIRRRSGLRGAPSGFRHRPKGGQGDPEQSVRGAGVRRTVITADTVASRELLVDSQSALLVPPGDPAALAAALRRLAGDPRCARIAEGGLRVYRERASEDVLGARWRLILERVIASAHDSREPRSPR